MQRLAHGYTEQLLAVFPDRVQALGKGLAMNEERLKVSSPSESPNTMYMHPRNTMQQICEHLSPSIVSVLECESS